MHVIQNIRFCSRNYAKFSGRSSRSQYRDFRIFSVVPLVIIFALVGFSEYPSDPQSSPGPSLLRMALFWILLLWWAALIIPAIATTARRFHDIDLRGWWTILPIGFLTYALIVVWGQAWVNTGDHSYRYAAAGYLIIILFLMSKKGTTGGNRFGLDPLTGNSDQRTIDLPPTK